MNDVIKTIERITGLKFWKRAPEIFRHFDIYYITFSEYDEMVTEEKIWLVQYLNKHNIAYTLNSNTECFEIYKIN